MNQQTYDDIVSILDETGGPQGLCAYELELIAEACGEIEVTDTGWRWAAEPTIG